MKWLTVCIAALAGWLASTDPPDKPPVSPPPTRSRTTGYVRGTVGGVHDFSRLGAEQAVVCNTCHIPHVQGVRAVKPGGSRAAGGGLDDPRLELYRIQGQRQTFEPGRYTPGPTSLICLGCHDGTLARSTIGSAHAMLAGVRAGFAVPDGFVWRDHPIGVPYPRGDRAYKPLSQLQTGGGLRLPEGRIECVTCHDPHNQAGIDKLLAKSNRRSALCLTCHVK